MEQALASADIFVDSKLAELLSDCSQDSDLYMTGCVMLMTLTALNGVSYQTCHVFSIMIPLRRLSWRYV